MGFKYTSSGMWLSRSLSKTVFCLFLLTFGAHGKPTLESGTADESKSPDFCGKENNIREDRVVVTCGNCSCIRFAIGARANYTCHVSASAFQDKIDWFYKFADGSEREMPKSFSENTSNVNGIRSTRREVKLPNLSSMTTGVICRALRQNSNDWVEGSEQVLPPVRGPPRIVNGTHDKNNETGLVELSCSYISNLRATVSWERNGEPWSPPNQLEDLTVNPRVMSVKNIPEIYTPTKYSCIVTNADGTDRKTFDVQRQNETSVVMVNAPVPLSWYENFVTLSLLCLLITSVVLPAPFLLKLWRNIRIQKWIKQHLNKDDPVKSSELKIDYGSCTRFDGGKFGDVWRTTVVDDRVKGNRREAVIKTFMWPPNLTEKQAKRVFIENFIEEVRIMQKLYKHLSSSLNASTNIVQYLGYGAPSIKNFKVCLVMELCFPGQLEKFLSDHEMSDHYFNDCRDGVFLYQEQQDSYNNYPECSIVCTSHVMKWAEQVACGMACLARLGMVHRDLAARNILLQCDVLPGNIDDCYAKIGDFGMARVLSDINSAYESYETTTDPTRHKPRPKPVRWWAPEALASQNAGYTLKCDVWSYGVLLWEMFNLSKEKRLPYSETEELHNLQDEDLHDGLVNFLSNPDRRLRRPTVLNPPDELWQLIQNCWQGNPDHRPDFSHIHTTIKEINTDHGLYVERVGDMDEHPNDEDEEENGSLRDVVISIPPPLPQGYSKFGLLSNKISYI